MDPAHLETLRAGVRLMALRGLRDADAADEAAQETLTRALTALAAGRPDDPDRLGAFVAGVARHVIADVHRRSARVLPLDAVPEPMDTAPNALAIIIRDDERARVRRALDGLVAGDRELLRLCFFEGLEPTEIARRRGEPPERIRKRKERALARLRAALTESHDTHVTSTTPAGDTTTP
jgi:RNA polymerase sigma-70 factor (ECF subfamily)